MTTPSSVPTPPVPPTQAEPVTPEVAKTAARLVRAKSFAKNTFVKVGTPLLAGAAGGLVVLRSARNRQDSDLDIDTVDDSTE